MQEKGLLIVLSGPSGVGKGTVRKEIFSHSDTSFEYSISMTTRKPREGEVDGVDYFFKSREEFEELIAQEKLLEYAEFVGNYYGTPVDYVRETLIKEKMFFLKLKFKAHVKLEKNFPRVYLSFLCRRVLSELKNRIETRGTETEEIINNRLNVAKEEIEMMNLYDYVVENDQIDLACERIKAIVVAEHCRRERVEPKYLKMLEGN